MSAPEQRLWPSWFDLAAALAVAVAVFSLEAWVGTAIGRTQSLAYDGLGYAAHARVKYFQLETLLEHPLQYLRGFTSYLAGLWAAFLVLTYAIAGVGEVQSFLAWLWHVALLLVLVIWVARVTGDRAIAVLLGIFTALLPLCSPMLWLAINYQLGFDWLDVMEANLADARPDPLAHAFMLWAVVPLLVQGRAATTRTFIFTALAAAASVMSKSTVAPLTAGCWGVAILYVAWLRRDDLHGVIKASLWAGATFFVALLPWMVSGGLREAVVYAREAYSLAPFYKRGGDTSKFIHFPFHHYFLMLQYFFTWPVVALAALAGAYGGFRIWRQGDSSTRHLLGGVLVLAAAISLPLYLQVLRNHYIGIPLYLALWLAAVVCAAYAWRVGLPERRLRVAAAAILIASFSAVAAIANLGVANWPQEDLRRLLEGRRLIREIAADLRKVLTPKDTFAGLVLASGWPLILQFHMTTDATGYPPSFRFWPPDGPAIATSPEARVKFIRELEGQAKVIITFKEAPERVYRQARMSEFWLPHFNAIHEHLNSGASRYQAVKQYDFPEPGRLFFPPAAGSVVMYVRDDVRARP